MAEQTIERVPAPLEGLIQTGTTTYVGIFGLEEGHVTICFEASTISELVTYLSLLRQALGQDVW